MTDPDHFKASRIETRCAGKLTPPLSKALGEGLSGALVDLGFGQGAQRVIDDDRDEVGHAERVTLHLRLMQKFGGDDDRRRTAKGLEAHAVMRTARCA